MKTCNDCRFYSTLIGTCERFGGLKHGYEPSCSGFEQQTDVEWEDEE